MWSLPNKIVDKKNRDIQKKSGDKCINKVTHLPSTRIVFLSSSMVCSFFLASSDNFELPLFRVSSPVFLSWICFDGRQTIQWIHSSWFQTPKLIASRVALCRLCPSSSLSPLAHHHHKCWQCSQPKLRMVMVIPKKHLCLWEKIL